MAREDNENDDLSALESTTICESNKASIERLTFVDERSKLSIEADLKKKLESATRDLVQKKWETISLNA